MNKKKITLTNVVLEENNHVGNEWYYEAHINNVKMQKDKPEILFPINGGYTIDLKVWEKDKIDDVGRKQYFVSESELYRETENRSFTVVAERYFFWYSILSIR